VSEREVSSSGSIANGDLAAAAALFRLRKRLVSRPKWLEVYSVLADEDGADAVRVEYALHQWLQEEFSHLREDEIALAMRRLAVDSPFAPDLRVIRQTCLDTAVRSRYGEAHRLFAGITAKVAHWMTGSAVDWIPVEAYMVREFGARRLAESSYSELRKEWQEALYKFIVTGEPKTTDRTFSGKSEKNDINIISAHERKKFNVLSIRAILKREVCGG